MKKKILVSLIALFTIIFSFQTIERAKADVHHDLTEYSINDFNRALKGDKNLRKADLEEADLRGADLRNADLWDADLEGANLEGADLRNANLRKADLEEVNLKGAKIDGAQLKGAELESAMWVDGKICAEDSVGYCR